MKHLLTIAGSDSGGGAGIQADIKTFSAHGCYAMSVITAVTAQNTCAVTAVQDITPEMIGAQMDAVFSDIRVDAVKIGMVSQIASIRMIAEKLRQYCPRLIVVDPVMVSKSGFHLLQPDAVEALKQELVPLAVMLTPNIPEAEILTDMSIVTPEDRKRAALKLKDMGAAYVLIKGGHLQDTAEDLLYDGKQFYTYGGERIETKNTHGTGCTLSSAIAANLANGMTAEQAVRAAKEYITVGIRNGLELGAGCGPTNHFYTLYRKAGMADEKE